MTSRYVMSCHVMSRSACDENRFAGAELEAAAALVSVLRTESDIGKAKAAATLRAAGAGVGNQRAGEDLRAALGAQLPLPALLAAAQSLRKIGGIARRELDPSAAEGGGGAAGEGGVNAGGGVGQPSAVRLARYLTRQGDK